MASEITYPHIVKPDGEPARLERIPRIRVAQLVVDYLAYGWSAEEMCRQHPYLSLAEAHAAMTYYYDHQEEIDKEIQQEQERIGQEKDQAPRTSLVARLQAERHL